MRQGEFRTEVHQQNHINRIASTELHLVETEKAKPHEQW